MWQSQHLPLGTRASRSQACLQTTERVSPGKRPWLNHFRIPSLMYYILALNKLQSDDLTKEV